MPRSYRRAIHGRYTCAMIPVGKIHVVELFPKERAALLELLSGLQPDEWGLPTVCDGWRVKDVAAHILADDLGRLSRDRDGHTVSFIETDSWVELIDAINAQNERWVESMRRLSPQIIIELLEFSGERHATHMKALDLDTIGGPVSWAGPDPAPVWFDLAREYTEYWAHQQQIRDAVLKPGLKERSVFGPVLDCYVRALPHTYRGALGPEGTHVRVRISGDAGGVWSLVRDGGQWSLFTDVLGEPTASVTLDQEVAWRVFTRGITPEAARALTVLGGDIGLAATALETVSILA